LEEDLIYNFSLLIFHSSEYIYFPQEEKIFFDKKGKKNTILLYIFYFYQ